uniref:RxLR effector protein n=1 Tax=Aureoumbra lagunensis TaxID=44058 RepID=A0A7S3NKN6_9STRA|mmetsp:Transcript_21007/g.27238  ORF Transcript_21007/g.27238 Transcript_21007/m.27238 type:complete len:158 (+) Transcript_21007:58-531(+)|eukprot:CAMPEP_0197286048 /NCGR_PEP_ID=MMETSP0890-20130614/1448_1 /TAXON_ID=44058 ORGANISM="Aureoumbra lagunensis, Strain CCMP1510" /NCGR_SAMPLE_ID=MMETSP0890 /ASSEMBLY_ACC=CAM_ASM_000533 /LENGTH=157 /DNA_ID=CAMNT_0042754071 /DNA_START=36 /DNA_END=509 /DNA_ORIENTATION=-
MKLAIFSSIVVTALAFNFGGKPKTQSKGVTSSNKSVAPKSTKFGEAFGNFALLEERKAIAAAKAEADKAALIPTPEKFIFAFGRPDLLRKRREERLAKWEWSDSFLSRARPDKNNYGAGDYFDDGLTKLERAQIASGKEAYLTGGAKLRLKVLRGEL